MRKLFFLWFLFVTACKEMYNPPIQSPTTGYLVVEGVINSGAGVTDITLSRTTGLNNSELVFESGALLQVEGEDNGSMPIPESGQGHYIASDLNLNISQRYRLRITTSNGKEYLSAFAKVLKNPAIDSISRKRENGGMQLYINTHDPENKTLYYQWSYHETWEFHSKFGSSLKYDSTQGPQGLSLSVDYRLPSQSADPSIFTCWSENPSTTLLIGSSAKLSSDVIFLPLIFIPEVSQKLTVLYSVKVKQYAWTREGYEFLDRMKRNTESTGSLFDGQPSELNGNIQCITDPSEQVVGYVNICNIEEKRMFIDHSEVPDWKYIASCPSIIIDNVSDSITLYGAGKLPTYVDKLFMQSILSFYAAPAECVDCTITGSNIKPAFWP